MPFSKIDPLCCTYHLQIPWHHRKLLCLDWMPLSSYNVVLSSAAVLWKKYHRGLNHDVRPNVVEFLFTTLQCGLLIVLSIMIRYCIQRGDCEEYGSRIILVLCIGSGNQRRRYIVTSSLMGLAHTQNDPCRSFFSFANDISYLAHTLADELSMSWLLWVFGDGVTLTNFYEHETCIEWR